MSDFPAYPNIGGKSGMEKGITRRELFAAMAMQGMISAQDWDWRNQKDGAINAVSFAEALIVQLDKPDD